MLIRKPLDVLSSEITPKSVYINRRKFIAGASAATAGLMVGRGLLELVNPGQKVLAGTKLSGVVKSSFNTDEKQTPYKDVTHYNNFYEFGTAKEEPAEKAKNFKTAPWSVSVEGAVGKPRT